MADAGQRARRGHPAPPAARADGRPPVYYECDLARGAETATWPAPERHKPETFVRTPDEKHVMMLAPDGRGLIRDMTAGTSREMRLSMDAVVATGGGPAEVVRLWDIESQQPVVSLGVGRGNFIETAFSPDGTVLGSASHTGQLRLWRAPSQEEIEAAERPRAATAEK